MIENKDTLNKVISLSSDLLFYFEEAKDYKTYILNRFSEETVREFNIGYFPKTMFLGLINQYIDTNDLINLGLISQYNNFSFFENHNLIIPHYDIIDAPISIMGRTILSDDKRADLSLPKYKNTIFKKGNYLFNLSKAKPHILENGFVYIVEGQFDAMKCWENGIKNVVAVGSSSLSSYQCASISRYTDNMFILFDSDEAGFKGRNRVESKFSDRMNITNVYVPFGYKDIDEYITANKEFAIQFEYE